MVRLEGKLGESAPDTFFTMLWGAPEAPGGLGGFPGHPQAAPGRPGEPEGPTKRGPKVSGSLDLKESLHLKYNYQIHQLIYAARQKLPDRMRLDLEEIAFFHFSALCTCAL